MSRGNENEESRRAALQGVKIMRGLLPRPTSAKASSRERVDGKERERAKKEEIEARMERARESQKEKRAC